MQTGEELTTERHKTHGDFGLNAAISQALKGIMAVERRADMPDVHRESLEMIAMKISRICSGQSLHADHWDDIIGYATLARKLCR